MTEVVKSNISLLIPVGNNPNAKKRKINEVNNVVMKEEKKIKIEESVPVYDIKKEVHSDMSEEEVSKEIILKEKEVSKELSLISNQVSLLNQVSLSNQELIEEKLKKEIPKEFLKVRKGPANVDLLYISRRNAINLANEVFGFDGWKSDIKEFIKEGEEILSNQQWKISYTATVRITLRDGSYREDIGGGSMQDRDKLQANLNAKKKASSDALKRALSQFGDYLGGSLYEKEYTNNILKKYKFNTTTGNIIIK